MMTVCLLPVCRQAPLPRIKGYVCAEACQAPVVPPDVCAAALARDEAAAGLIARTAVSSSWEQ